MQCLPNGRRGAHWALITRCLTCSQNGSVGSADVTVGKTEAYRSCVIYSESGRQEVGPSAGHSDLPAYPLSPKPRLYRSPSGADLSPGPEMLRQGNRSVAHPASVLVQQEPRAGWGYSRHVVTGKFS